MKIAAGTALSLVLACAMASAQSQPGTSKPAVENGSKVQIEYTLTLDHGQRQIIRGLEKAVEGMHAGEEKKVVVKAADAYGEANPAAVAEVPKERIPSTALTVGTELLAQGSSGQTRTVRVKEIKEQTVVLDMNHPLAGTDLTFAVKVLSVEPPAKEGRRGDAAVAGPATHLSP
ncbi:MAG: peptidylprolyl isomerase [Zetaproteobacteria bacterium]|nr:MAG: peptidylprolyl isomerase [Zetaproteobacteria bacterium]